MIFVVCCSTGLHAQTIADIARQERAKRKETPKTTAPITNARVAKAAKGSEVSSAPATPAPTTPSPDTIPATPLAVSPIPQTATKPPAPEPTKAPEAKKDERDEQWWRNEFDKARVEVRRAENQAAVAQLELNAANRDYLTRSYDPDGRGPTAIGAATAKLDAAKKNVEAARARLALLEEELRRSGAPAGWAR
jgi:hypothetical protein